MDELDFSPPADLTNCDREPIQHLGKIQSFGCFLALQTDWIVAVCSDNAEDFLGIAPEELIGQALHHCIDHQTLHNLRTALQSAMITGRNERLFEHTIEATQRRVDFSVHHNGDYIIVEMEVCHGPREPHDTFVRSLLSQFYMAKSGQELGELVTQQLQLITGYDRVMLYRFLPDGAGEVVAESKNPDLSPLLGLRYPASDIPKQARALYLKSLLRVIGDVNDPTVALINERPDSPVDMSFSTLRAVSPIHIEYLKNMGVEASLSVSVIIRGKLWGLIACHHYTPKVPSYYQRTELELFAEIFALEMGARVSAERDKETSRTRDIMTQLIATMSSQGVLIDMLENQFPQLKMLIPCDGVTAFIDGHAVGADSRLNEETLLRLTRYLNAQAPGKVIAINALDDAISGYDTDAQRIAGVLAVPISKSPRDYLLFFRHAQTQTIKWAGNPEKAVTHGPNGARLSPRASFDVWMQTHNNRCHEWSEQNVSDAESLRVTLLEIVIRHVQERDHILQEASRKHEVLISELNHRVRNILNLVNAIILQTDQNERSVAEFVNVLTGRMVALASAHDQLTASEWSKVNFRHILETEIMAYIDLENHVTLSGPDVELKPDAATPIVLVIHEMFTNAAKYGALAASLEKGKVSVQWTFEEGHGLTLKWEETGGPPVSPPKREGFGMTLIRSVIPHELGGRLDIDFAPVGVNASIFIPERYVSAYSAPTSETSKALPETKATEAPTLPERALVVEDSLVIALDVQAKLKRMGIAQVAVAGTIETARAQVQTLRPGLVVFDIHLGKETTLGLLQEVINSHTPCLIVSGYGEQLNLPARFDAVPVVSKPVSEQNLTQVVSTLFPSHAESRKTE